MKSKNLIVTCVWIFVTVIVVGYLSAGILWTDYNMMYNVFSVGLLLFFIALIFTGAIVYLIPENADGESALLNELRNIRSKLDKLTCEVELIKKG